MMFGYIILISIDCYDEILRFSCFSFDWENISNTQDSVRPHFLTPGSSPKILHYVSFLNSLLGDWKCGKRGLSYLIYYIVSIERIRGEGMTQVKIQVKLRRPIPVLQRNVTLWPFAFVSILYLTLGTKTRPSVKVVQNMVRNDVRANWIVGWSNTIPRIGITRIQGMMTL